MNSINLNELVKTLIFGMDLSQPVNDDETIVKRLDCDIVKIQFLLISEKMATKLSIKTILQFLFSTATLVSLIMLTQYITTNTDQSKNLQAACQQIRSVEQMVEYKQGDYIGCFKQKNEYAILKDVDEFDTFSIQINGHPTLPYNGLYQKVANNPLIFKNY